MRKAFLFLSVVAMLPKALLMLEQPIINKAGERETCKPSQDVNLNHKKTNKNTITRLAGSQASLSAVIPK